MPAETDQPPQGATEVDIDRLCAALAATLANWWLKHGSVENQVREVVGFEREAA